MVIYLDIAYITSAMVSIWVSGSDSTGYSQYRLVLSWHISIFQVSSGHEVCWNSDGPTKSRFGSGGSSIIQKYTAHALGINELALHLLIA